jgi:hypothetical protein
VGCTWDDCNLDSCVLYAAKREDGNEVGHTWDDCNLDSSVLYAAKREDGNEVGCTWDDRKLMKNRFPTWKQ